MSDTSQGPGWWLASDGKWYPPELWTGGAGTGPPIEAAPSSSLTASPSRSPSPSPSPSPSNTGTPARFGYAGTPTYPAGHGQSVYGAVPAQKTNGLAVASLVCSCLGLFFLPMILGIVFGFVARSQIRAVQGAQRGEGLAIAGIIVGLAWAAFFVVSIIVAAVHSNTNSVVVPTLTGGIASPLAMSN